jgi:hypothetical protein
MGDLTAFVFLVFLVIAGLLAFQLLLRQQQVAELRRTGQRVIAGVTRVVHERVQTNPGATIPGPPDLPNTPAPPTFADRWYIECQWTDPKTRYTYTFRSDAVDQPTAALYAPSAPITVLIQPGDPDTYFVEVAE